MAEFRQFSVKFSEVKDKEILLSLDLEIKKQNGKITPAFRKIHNDNLDMKKAISEKDKELKELREKLTYVEDYANGKKEELYKKVTTFPFHNKCYDMLLVEGNPDARESICPPSKRPVVIVKDKKTGRYFVYDSRLCGRCLALGCRKETTQKPQTIHHSKPQTPKRDWCKRNERYREYLDPTCLECLWTASECLVKKRIQKLAIQ